MSVPLKAGGLALPGLSTSAWSSALGDSAKEVFSMMVATEVTVAADEKLPVLADVTGVIGIGGAFSGVFSLRCSAGAANSIASQMLGVPAEEASSQSADAIGEICNMVAGQFKAKIGHEATCMLSIPTVITGKDYSLHSSRCAEIEMPLLYNGEPVWIALDIRK
ncbi:MAG TPA: chemotaxis protein CheX [Terriglobales bacterium]|nr:chemotaxis protein CheX [Terriglobales bacterium]